MKINRILQIALLMELSLGTLAGAQTAIASDPSLDPHLFLTLQDFEARKTIAQREPWAKAALAALLKEADGYPQDDLNRFGLTKVAAPEKKKSLLKSAIFPEAGYAMLRAKNNDLSVILKFGPHGGGRGHYDKLGEIVHAEGRTQAVDPGTQLYGMALHKEWDQMSVAHNTITADESRQDQATGKLVAWKDGEDGYVAVTASAGPAYKFADLTRSILVTDDYVLQVARAQSSDGKPHVFDVNHNYGKQTMQLQTTPYSGFPEGNGYAHLEQVQRAKTSDSIMTHFDNDGTTMSLDVLGGVPLRRSFRGSLRDRILPRRYPS